MSKLGSSEDHQGLESELYLALDLLSTSSRFAEGLGLVMM